MATISLCALITGFCMFVVLLVMGSIETHNGRMYRYNNVTCDKPNGHLFSLKSWCYTNGVVTLVAACLISSFAAGVSRYGKTTAAISVGVTCGLYVLFEIAWTTSGAVQLFKYSSACKSTDRNLYNITFASLVIHWISLSIFIVGPLFTRDLLSED